VALARPLSCMPFPLGAVLPVANTPLRICSNFTDMNSEVVSSLWIQALPSNTGTVYILSQQSAVAKDLVLYSNVVSSLDPGQGIPLNGKYMNQVSLGTVWVDPVVSGEGVFASIQEI
jgi:hypothetical protein